LRLPLSSKRNGAKVFSMFLAAAPQDPDLNWLTPLAKPEATQLRRLVIELVLGTDM
jgi:hypothetical protein